MREIVSATPGRVFRLSLFIKSVSSEEITWLHLFIFTPYETKNYFVVLFPKLLFSIYPLRTEMALRKLCFTHIMQYHMQSEKLHHFLACYENSSCDVIDFLNIIKNINCINLSIKNDVKNKLLVLTHVLSCW